VAGRRGTSSSKSLKTQEHCKKKGKCQQENAEQERCIAASRGNQQKAWEDCITNPWANFMNPEEMIYIIEAATELFAKDAKIKEITFEGNVKRAVVVGDLHGNFDDLMRILSFGYTEEEAASWGYAFGKNPGPRDENNTVFLFNGDLVDRGINSVEILLLVSALKILYPDRIFVNRGNHENIYGWNLEAKTPSMEFGNDSFFAEMRNKLPSGFKQSRFSGEKTNEFAMYSALGELFDRLSLGTVIGNDVFVAHAGVPVNVSGGEVCPIRLAGFQVTRMILDQRRDVYYNAKPFVKNDVTKPSPASDPSKTTVTWYGSQLAKRYTPAEQTKVNNCKALRAVPNRDAARLPQDSKGACYSSDPEWQAWQLLWNDPDFKLSDVLSPKCGCAYGRLIVDSIS